MSNIEYWYVNDSQSDDRPISPSFLTVGVDIIYGIIKISVDYIFERTQYLRKNILGDSRHICYSDTIFYVFKMLSKEKVIFFF